MLAVEIPDGLLTALVSVSFPLVVGMLVWIVRELARISTQQTRLEERQAAAEKLAQWQHDAAEGRLRKLEHAAGLHGRHDPHAT